jgi:hypothetical protein
MKKALNVLVVTMVVALSMPSAAVTAAPIAAGVTAGTVKVTINYKGKGTVDASHKLVVWLFDSPNIGAGSMPIDLVMLEKNGADAVFNGVVPEKVWIAVAYDESGSMTGDGPPPTGTPVGVLSGSDGAPAAVTPGGKDAVVLTFDDSFRMP